MTAIDADAIARDLLAEVAAAADPDSLEAVRVAALGRRGRLTEQMKGLGALDPEARREAGQALNRVKDAVTAAIEARKTELEGAAAAARIAAETVDVTLPARPHRHGRLHPIGQVMEECIAIFGEMGFAVAEGPDIEDDFHNFEALNMPPEHPARQMHDTFYLPGDMAGGGGLAHRVLRTHTSPVQIRAMKAKGAPLRVIAPGRTYRSDSDATHTPMFHQIEALALDRNIHMGHLKGCIIDFCRAFFAVPDLPVRFRPSHFPFTEPSMEVDIGCSRAGGELKIGNFGDGADNWLEIMGSGMVHPKVIAAGGIDPDVYQGFAFGMGIDRIAMLKYGIPDLRTFFEADVRWLGHYGFGPLDVPSMTRGL
ncbi:MAG: phenylalanine--tRNA ligase subunit alpha [Alphaproteobacteria bacterium]